MISIVALLALQTELKPFARVTLPALNEMSGFIAGGRRDDLFWTLNDSGNQPTIFAIRKDGSVVRPNGFSGEYSGIKIAGAKNVDWECLTRLGKQLVIGDIGNNANARRDLGLYVVSEPDPSRETEISQPQFVPIAYPDQKEFPPAKLHFDCEAMFAHRGKLYFITKHRQNQLLADVSAAIYRLDSSDTTRKNVLVRVDSARDLGGWVTDACMSPDGSRLAVLTQFPVASVWLFDTPKSGDRFFQSKSRQIRFLGGKQCEGLCWEDSKTVLINNEQRDIFRINVD